MQKYPCALCDRPLYVGSDMITVNVDGHSRAAHRFCDLAADDERDAKARAERLRMAIVKAKARNDELKARMRSTGTGWPK